MVAFLMKASTEKRGYAFFSLICAALFGTAIAFPFLLHIVFKFFINFFSYGSSSIRVLLFFSYGFFAGMALLLLERWKKHIVSRARIFARVAIVFVSVAFIFGTLYSAAFYAQRDIPFRDTLFVSDRSDLSASALYHNHIPKIGISLYNGLLRDVFGTAYEGGEAYADTISPEIALLFSFLFAVSVFLVFVSVVQKTMEYREHHEREHWVYFMLLLIASFSVLKNIPDGGAFSHETILFLPIMATLLLSSPAHSFWRRAKNTGIAVAAYFFVAGGILVVIYGFSYAVDTVMIPFFQSFVFIAALFGAWCAARMKRAAWFFFCVTILLTVMYNSFSYSYTQKNPRYFLNHIEKGDVVRFVSEKGGDDKKIYDFSGVGIYESVAEEDETHFSFVKKRNLSYAFPSAQSISDVCPLFPDSGMRVRGTIISMDDKTSWSAPLLAENEIVRVEVAGDCRGAGCRAPFEILFYDRCFPWFEKTALQQFHALGISRYILSDVSFTPVKPSEKM